MFKNHKYYKYNNHEDRNSFVFTDLKLYSPKITAVSNLIPVGQFGMIGPKRSIVLHEFWTITSYSSNKKISSSKF